MNLKSVHHHIWSNIWGKSHNYNERQVSKTLRSVAFRKIRVPVWNRVVGQCKRHIINRI